ncbi:MAG: DUF2064 domain-containing protein [Haloarculaceae archaeon]
MTVAVVLAEPPVAGVPLPGLVDSVLDGNERARLYRAMLADASRALQEGGADLLVNYRPSDQVEATGDADPSVGPDGDVDSEREVREALRDLIPRPEEARYEVQVGTTLAGRVGNTVSHLLDQEGADSVAVVDPRAPFFDRAAVGQATMKLRSADLVLGPAPGGRVYYIGFTDTVDFDDALASPAVETLTDRAVDAGLEVDFLPVQPVVEQPADLVDLVAGLRARRRAERRLPAATAAVVDELDLRVTGKGVVATSDNS